MRYLCVTPLAKVLKFSRDVVVRDHSRRYYILIACLVLVAEAWMLNNFVQFFHCLASEVKCFFMSSDSVSWNE